MTDNEIIKALEDILHRIKGAENLIVPKEGVENLCDGLQKALDLINRLQAENERLKYLLEREEKATLSLSKQCYKDGAKEFAENVHTEIHEALESNYKAKAERTAKPNVEMADEFVSYCEGKIAALRGIDDFIDDLLKEKVGEK